ncbi:MAG TPA: GIY-YIG nuclease family protein [Vitreimonas sp.]|nr:GIY-YIG nuclease family protein [Vitreimonas sp.]
MHYTYILFSSLDKQLYIGFTSNLRSRLKAHYGGFVKATQKRRPLKLICYLAFEKEEDARRSEKYLKGGNGRTQLKKQLWSSLSELKYKNLFKVS